MRSTSSEQAELEVQGETLHAYHGTRSASSAVKGMGSTSKNHAAADAIVLAAVDSYDRYS
eukprot:5093202-Amphidinium_carterae.1